MGKGQQNTRIPLARPQKVTIDVMEKIPRWANDKIETL